MYTYAISDVRVIDGDTLECDFDLGFKVRVREKVRLLGYDAPEAGTPEGDGATLNLEKFIENAKSLTLQTTKQGKYGRWLGTLYADGECVNSWMIEQYGEYLK